jgi:hypothetical protein
MCCSDELENRELRYNAKGGAGVDAMSKTVTLEIPEEVERDAREIAARTQRRLEDVLTEWLGRFAAELPVDALPDDRVLELADMQMPPEQQEMLSHLLALSSEGPVSDSQRQQLDELMQIYRRGLVRKAEALKVAVQRGLRPPLGE